MQRFQVTGLRGRAASETTSACDIMAEALHRRAGEELQAVNGAAPNGLKPQRCQSQRDRHNVRMIDVSGPQRSDEPLLGVHQSGH